MESVLRLYSEIAQATDGGVPELSFDFVYFPQDITGSVLEYFKIKTCAVCEEPLNKDNMRALVPRNEGYVAICKEINCLWRQ